MDRDADVASGPGAPSPGNGKSKLDTLSKEDLITFAKKQMAVIQKLKAKCADLEKEVKMLKAVPSENSDDTVIQELTDRMDAVLLEKAETQQTLVLLRKENEKVNKQAQEAMEHVLQLQEKLDNINKEHMEKIKVLEEKLETSETKHREELKLIKQMESEKNENEEIQRNRLMEKFNSQIEAVHQGYEDQVRNLQHDLEFAKKEHCTEIEALVETHQMTLRKSHENLQNLQDEIAKLSRQREEQLKISAVQVEMERERCLRELSEQQVVKDSYLQDVEEEEEESNGGPQKASGTLKMSESLTLEESDESLRLTLQDLQSQNAMLQEEIKFLSNVKTELETNLKHIKEEFLLEREELEFKINELQMTRGDTDTCLEKDVQILNELKTVHLDKHEQEFQELQELHKTELKELEARLISTAEYEKEAFIQELKDLQYQCRLLEEEKTTVVNEYEHTKEILKNLELELADGTSNFVSQYNAMKERAALSVQELQDKLREKESVITKLESDLHTRDGSSDKCKERLEQIRGDLERMLDECKCGQMDTVQLTRQDLEGLSGALEGALAERNHFRSFVAHLEGQLSYSAAEEEQLAKHCGAFLEDQAAPQDPAEHLDGGLVGQASVGVNEKTDVRSELQPQLLGEDSRRHISEILKQNFSVIIAEEDIPALLNQLLYRVQKDNIVFTQQHGTPSPHSPPEERGGEEGLGEVCVQDVFSRTERFEEDLTEMQTQNDISPVDSENCSEGEKTQTAAVQQHERPTDEAGKQETKESLKSEDEVKSLQHKLREKEDMIAQLNGEISLLQEFKMSACNNNMTQIEILEKEIKEKDERMNKIKAVAVKARKELELSRTEVCALKEDLETMQAARDKLSESMKGIIHGAEDYKNLMMSYDKQTEVLDREREKLQQAEQLVGDLTKRLQAAVEQNKQLSSEREDLAAHMETVQRNVQQLEAQVLEMHKLQSGLERELETQTLIKEQKSKDHQSAIKELEEQQTLLQKQNQQLQQTQQELEQLRKDAQQNSLLDMEMADYERLVKELNVQLSEKNKLLEDQESLALAQRDREEKLREEIESLKSLVDIGEEKNSKMKQLLVKTKKDLADAKKEEASQMMIQSSLKGELECCVQQLEACKIQCSELLAERHRLQEQLKSVSDQQQKAASSSQNRISTLQEQLTSTKAELCTTLSEFEGYKVRVHNVLKQQKTRRSAPCDGEFSKEEREHMQSVLGQLRSKLQESELNLQSTSAELQQLQVEHDLLLERHNHILQQNIAKEAELRERLLSLHSENTALKSEHSQAVAQLTAQADALRSSFREQVHHLQDEQRTTVETLQQQISRLETQLFQLQKEPSSAGSTPAQQSRKSLPDRKLADVPVCELQSMAREEGEGMETAEMEPVSTSGNTPPSLEQLLTSPHPKHEPFVWQVEPSKEELNQRLNTVTRSMEHMNSLLHESEATNAVLMEQISVLKSELRRVECNQERERAMASLEYLKNVLLHFMVLQPGSEKQALLPVIHKLLQLNPDEKSKLAAIAQGDEEPAQSGRSGWTSYLHSWSGIR
ncbi:GRIP and coiled-coil domain-containing protein 2 isoform X2 [Brachyhypopomus gauderio]|uniref:GRIP and coiled-coil domain-containing protein 2 isoform X2 n=1 Tax=Brachyhypopomus gauderio TaxID=698409 RepID=UPI004042583A